jgi:hypothetical protein
MIKGTKNKQKREEISLQRTRHGSCPTWHSLVVNIPKDKIQWSPGPPCAGKARATPHQARHVPDNSEDTDSRQTRAVAFIPPRGRVPLGTCRASLSVLPIKAKLEPHLHILLHTIS